MRFKLSMTAAVVAALVLISSCAREKTGTVSPKAEARHDESEHGHEKGIKALGDYHARVLATPGGQLQLFVLGKDESKVASIERQEVKAHVRVAGESEAKPMTLKPDPQPGDPPGKTSQFSGALPEGTEGKPLVVTARLTIGGEAYLQEFETAAGGREAHVQAPQGLAGAGADEVKRLYLTPGGAYTAQDIAANGGITAHDKYKGAMASHDAKPKSGDRICPITDTKANARFTWIVGGKTYEFCCPPCIDEFVQAAKESPESIKDPTHYVKK